MFKYSVPALSLIGMMAVGAPSEASVIHNYNTRNITWYNDGTPTVTLIGPHGHYMAKCDSEYYYPLDDKGVGGWSTVKQGSNMNLSGYMGFITNKYRMRGCGDFYRM